MVMSLYERKTPTNKQTKKSLKDGITLICFWLMFDLKFYKSLFPMVRLIYVNAVYKMYPPRAYLIDFFRI